MKTLVLKTTGLIFKLNRFILTTNKNLAQLLFLPGFEKIRWRIGKIKVYLIYLKAKVKVPAYKQFIQNNQPKKMKFKGLVPNLKLIPETSKSNYVQKYSIADRCKNGNMNVKGVIIDESSGSSGTPTNWARGLKERKANKKFLQLSFKKTFGEDQVFFINAFAMGAWATGVNVTMAFSDISIIKSTGPDIDKIVKTLEQFGSNENYVIFGYPPFLKMLVDNSNIDFNQFNVSFIFGGESMSENMRNYLLDKGVKKVVSSYGASDLELNMATETEASIQIRKLLISNKKFARKVLRFDGALPMVFQYNPLDFVYETNQDGELVVSLAGSVYLSPKIRYNIKDRGHVIRKNEMKKLMLASGIDPNQIKNWNNDLPFLFHYGRGDIMVSYYGSNIYADDVQETLFEMEDLRDNFSTFTLDAYEDKESNKQLNICIEVKDKSLLNNIQSLKQLFLDKLALKNQDFKKALSMMKETAIPKLLFYNTGEGPFVNNDIRIKAKYIQ